MFFSSVSEQEKVDFAKSLAVMLKAGIPIDECLLALSEQTKNKSLARILLKIKKEVEYGNPLSVAFSKQEKIFGKMFSNLIRSGEVSGTLEENLIFLADWLERNNDLRQEVKAALFYPKFVIMAALLMAVVLSAYVLPKLIPLFRDLRVELPLTTRLLLGFASFVQNHFYQATIIVVGLFVFFKLINKIALVQIWRDYIALNFWIVGNIMVDYQLAIICQVLSALIKGGLSLGEILESAEHSVSNNLYRKSLAMAKHQVTHGVKLSDSLSRHPSLYPRNFLSIIAMGETSGTLEASLGYLTEYYSKEVLNKTKKLPTLIEPILLAFIAFGVLFIALSIVMPIYSLTKGLGS